LKLDWATGTGAATTYIRGKIGGYPADRTDGSLIYSGAAITFTHSPLIYGDSWYYRAWTYVAIDGLSQYSSTYAQAFETATGLPLAPTAFLMTQTNLNEATGTWVIGASASTTEIRWDINAYPATVTDGWEAYNGAGETFTKDGLLYDQYAYYWRAWSVNPAGYSVDYAQGTLGGENVAALATAFGDFNTLFSDTIILVLELIIFLSLTFLTFWRRDIILYLVNQYRTPDILAIAIGCGCIGLYSLLLAGQNLLDRVRN
jgi:hypothetical protein